LENDNKKLKHDNETYFVFTKLITLKIEFITNCLFIISNIDHTIKMNIEYRKIFGIALMILGESLIVFGSSLVVRDLSRMVLGFMNKYRNLKTLKNMITKHILITLEKLNL